MVTVQAACTGRDRLKAVGGQGTRGAHAEHEFHGRDLGRVEAERLVERRRALPSRKAGVRRGKRYGPGGVGALGGGDASSVHREGPTHTRLVGARARAERTRNMKLMSLTLDVSKLSSWSNACVSCRVERRACDAGRGAAREAYGRREVVGWRRRKRHARGEGPTQGLWGPGHARSAPGTCCAHS